MRNFNILIIVLIGLFLVGCKTSATNGPPELPAFLSYDLSMYFDKKTKDRKDREESSNVFRTYLSIIDSNGEESNGYFYINNVHLANYKGMMYDERHVGSGLPYPYNFFSEDYFDTETGSLVYSTFSRHHYYLDCMADNPDSVLVPHSMRVGDVVNLPDMTCMTSEEEEEEEGEGDTFILKRVITATDAGNDLANITVTRTVVDLEGTVLFTLSARFTVNTVGDVGDFEVKAVDNTGDTPYTITGTGIPEPEDGEEGPPV